MRNDTPTALAVRTSALTKIYGSKHVLSDINLEIREGERCCIVGANGSGKTTLLEMLLGLRSPSSGHIETLGRNPSDPGLKGLRVMLADRAAFPYLAKVKEIVWLYSGFYSEPIDIVKLVQSYDLDGNTYIRHLSKGQRQRLGIMLTLLGEPLLILLDEPTSGLDPHARLKFWQVLSQRLEQTPNCTLIFATHDLSEAERWADRIAILNHGRLIAICSPRDLCRSVIGTQRKLTIVGKKGLDPSKWQNGDVGSIAHFGDEMALYTDHPERVLSNIGLANDSVQIRIENVSVRDAFFKLTGEVPDGAQTLAVQKSV
jgi:ABC-2 type transport system ATP-binding protein